MDRALIWLRLGWLSGWLWTGLGLMMAVMAACDDMYFPTGFLVLSGALAAPLLRPALLAKGVRRRYANGGIWLFGLAGLTAIGVEADPARSVERGSYDLAAGLILVIFAGIAFGMYRTRSMIRNSGKAFDPERSNTLADHSRKVSDWIAEKARNRRKSGKRAAPDASLPSVLPDVQSFPHPAGRSPYSSPETKRRPAPNLMGRKLQEGPPGTRLIFEYADSQGVITTRRVTKWSEYPWHFKGYCSLRKTQRTFRKDGVLSWIDGDQHFLG